MTKQEKVIKLLSDNHYGIYEKSNQIMEMMESYHKQRVEAITDEEIENGLAEFGQDPDTYPFKIKGAKWLKQTLLNNG